VTIAPSRVLLQALERRTEAPFSDNDTAREAVRVLAELVIPVPLGWMVQARLRLEGLDATWPLLAELAWLAPARLAEVLPSAGDPLLDKLSRQFAAEFDGRADVADLAWFPAWLPP